MSGWDQGRQHPQPEDDDLVVRPFLLTGGRTRPTREDLRVETLVQSVPEAATSHLRFEDRQIVNLCQRPASVAEISATLRLPLGVVRILVSDLTSNGIVDLVQSKTLSVQLIERIRDRVRAL